jgi:transforming growth factor-beta-induced protein
MNRFTLPHSVLALTATLGFAVAQADDADSKAAKGNIVTVAVEAGSFQTLVAAVKAAGLAETLMGEGPFTVFAPTDEAFAKLGKETITELLKPENKAKLTSILTYHVVAGRVPAAKVVGMKSATSVQGAALSIEVVEGKVKVAGANVVATDVKATNGVIHVIDSVILPPSIVDVAKSAGSFGTLLTAAMAAGLADTLATKGPFTVFAPTDAAFEKLGKETITNLLKPENKDQLVRILKHHVVAGDVRSMQAVKLTEATTIAGTKLALAVKGKSLTVGGSTVTAADVIAGNGVIHVVDAVILPKD